MGYLSSILQCGYDHKRRKKPLQTVEIKVRMDCDGCEHKVKRALTDMKGVESVEIDRKKNKVTVTGHVEPNKVLKTVRSTGKKPEIWPYVPYNLIMQPYVVGTYDKKAPPGFVRNTEALTGQSQIRPEEHLTNLFSDDNPNACTVM